MGWFDQIKQVAAEKATSVLCSTTEKVRTTLDDVTSFEPQFQKVGYRLRDISIEMGLSPRVILFLSREFEADEEAFKAAQIDHPDSKMLSVLLNTLWQVNIAERSLRLEKRPFKGVEIEVALSPIVRLKYGDPDPETSPSETM